MSQSKFILEYYIANPNRDIPHSEAVDWVTKAWSDKTGSVFRDPDRAIRKLAQDGHLIKVSKGVYRYDPDFVSSRNLEDFTASQKKQILERDGYKCVLCGRSREEGYDLQVDHKKPKDFGGKATIDNGQTLCAPHNFLKKNYSQTQVGKRMFIELYETSKNIGDKKMEDFITEVLELYEKNSIDDDQVWRR